ncbi:DUF4148 domain-containing protein [Undibacterium sp. TS12]|uniref:DUF4148 domain-containing protein n=1 Tax=Undibacterium sp. TS12 TaxID=2908202 RepID=UPI001F4D0D10|nr:DUF4148 domain-containing protein [Undibacterium sp. TS12]MCH8622524.1 DUF4148 domain-containing protein [Undibacterium sp. TS12]
MNAKQLFLATSLIALTSTAAFAADTTPAPKTRAEVLAELQEARANGEEIGMEGYSWYPAQKAALVKANAETRLAAEKANAEKVAAKAQKTQQN